MLVLQADGGCFPNPGGPGRGAFVAFRDGVRVHDEFERLEKTTNNVAEWTGCLLALRWAYQQPAEDIVLQMDSQLVVHQLTYKWKVRKPHLLPFADEGKWLVNRIVRKGVKFRAEWIPRYQNSEADALTR